MADPQVLPNIEFVASGNPLTETSEKFVKQYYSLLGIPGNAYLRTRPPETWETTRKDTSGQEEERRKNYIEEVRRWFPECVLAQPLVPKSAVRALWEDGGVRDKKGRMVVKELTQGMHTVKMNEVLTEARKRALEWQARGRKDSTGIVQRIRSGDR
jgi:hypothetical protein